MLPDRYNHVFVFIPLFHVPFLFSLSHYSLALIYLRMYGLAQRD